jgi:hypothetical protein
MSTGSSMNYQPFKISLYTHKMLPSDYPQMQHLIPEEQNPQNTAHFSVAELTT